MSYIWVHLSLRVMIQFYWTWFTAHIGTFSNPLLQKRTSMFQMLFSFFQFLCTCANSSVRALTAPWYIGIPFSSGLYSSLIFHDSLMDSCHEIGEKFFFVKAYAWLRFWCISCWNITKKLHEKNKVPAFCLCEFCSHFTCLFRCYFAITSYYITVVFICIYCFSYICRLKEIWALHTAWTK